MSRVVVAIALAIAMHEHETCAQWASTSEDSGTPSSRSIW
jgi:hypothetical protein